MEKFKKMLPAILLALFETVVGIMLLINPEQFTIAVFIIFGAVLMICALIMLLRYLKDKNAAEKAAAKAASEKRRKDDKKGDQKGEQAEVRAPGLLPLISAITTFILGAVFAFGAGVLYDWTVLLLIFYGAIMVIKGVFKIADFISLRRLGSGVSVLRLIVGVLSIGVGLVMIIFNRSARDVMFTLTAISLLVEAALDLVTIFLGTRFSNTVEVKARVVSDTELNDGYLTDETEESF